MGMRSGGRLPSFCLNRIRPLVRVRSQSIQSKADQANSVKTHDQKTEDSHSSSTVGEENGSKAGGLIIGRRIMIVVDSSVEAKGAVQWALSHTVQSHDTLILLYVTKPSKQGEDQCGGKEVAPRIYDLLYSMKNVCQLKRPEVETEVVVVEGKGKEKGPTIVEEAKKQGVALLVLGQRKRSMTWRLVMMWAMNRVGNLGMVEYCIHNSDCMSIAVRRKSKRGGGYLITTKRHKDFWLLA